jgi:hypothetical protein
MAWPLMAKAASGPPENSGPVFIEFPTRPLTEIKKSTKKSPRSGLEFFYF